MGKVCVDCIDTCTGGCTGGCRGCTGSCSGSCTGCKGCSGCGYSCSYNCSGCSGGCTGCGYSCSYNCSGCSGYCSGYCSGGCTGCSGTCNTACNSTCTGGTQTTNINNLTLNDKMTASDMTKIKDAIAFEFVNRRGGSLSYTVTFTAGEAIDDAKITQIIANLSKAGQTASYSASAGATALKALASDLIAKIKAANNVTIGL